MPIDRDAWPQTFTEARQLKWLCGECGGTLVMLPGGLRASETGPSKRDHDHPAWEPEWITGRFAADYGCASCGDLAIIVGDYKLYEDPESFQSQHLSYFPVYKIRAIDPAPRLIAVPEEVPRNIRDQLLKAFRLFWIDDAACANALRGAVALFLDHRKVRKTATTPEGRRRLALHARIQEFITLQAHLGGMLMAAKWIGNDGSHAEAVAREELFDAFDLLEHVLHESYASDSKRLEGIAKRVNRRRKRRHKRTS